MPRPKKEGSAEPKKRSRTGCWPCKARKVKCGEEKPACTNCVRSGESCDYSIRLNWGGRTRKDAGSPDGTGTGGSFTFVATPSSISASAAKTGGGGHEHVFSSQHIATAPSRDGSRPRSRTSGTPLPTTPDEKSTSGAVAGQEQIKLPAFRQHQRHVSDLVQYQTGDTRQLPPYSHFASGLQSPAAAQPRSPPTSAPTDFRWSPQHAAKRIKTSSRTGSPAASQMSLGQPAPSPVFAVAQYPPQPEQQTPVSTYLTPHSIGSIVNTPATPSSSTNPGSPYPGAGSSLTVQDPPDLRRLSVKSLLSDPSEDADRPRYPRTDSYGYRTHGYDHGLPDLDVPRNDDHAAIGPRSPDLRRASAAPSDVSTSSNEPDARHIAFESGGYYASPVAIKIPRNLEPLPRELTDNPMNLLYFHHFLNHTARIMVPHDCFENPLRGVLPQMAVRNNQLLHLMLAFSASHRAQLLGHPEPANRIAEWMSDVLPALRQALDGPSSPSTISSTDASDPTDPTSLAPLATAIMLASLEIISPNTFAVPIPWQSHLQIARQLIIAKGGLHHLAVQKADGARDKAIFFLSRWFAYLDVLGSLSGSNAVQPLWGAYLEDGGGLWLVNRSDEEIYQIDCFFGFSGRCIALLAAVAELAVSCETDRMDVSTRQPRPEWQPEDVTRQRAEELRLRLEASAKCVYRGCMHTSAFSPSARPDTPFNNHSDQDLAEIYATNSMFHYAALIHLSRRVLNLPHSSPTVQNDVQRTVEALDQIRKGSTAESCLLFPIFTAGCEASSVQDREVFMERLVGVEGWGMAHVGAARRLMERVWEARDSMGGQEDAGWVDWVGWAGGEFFG